MPDELSDPIQARLRHLMQSVQTDCQCLESHPGGQAVFQALFDSLQSTLQNMSKSPADEPES
jgi:hypothetical protein